MYFQPESDEFKSKLQTGDINNLLKTFEKNIAQKYKEDFLNDNSTHYKQIIKDRIFDCK